MQLTPPRPAGENAAVKSADRALAILEYVARRGSARFQDVLDEGGLPRSSAHGLLRTLVARGWLAHDPISRTYTLGLRAWHVGQRYAGHRDLADLAKPLMDALAEQVAETVQLARLDGIENVYIAISESPHPMRLASSVGMRLHAHATGIGKALLAQLDPEEARRRLSAVVLPRFTSHTVTDVDQLMELLDGVREVGYALDEEEYLPGTRCAAVPLLDDGKDLIAALSVTAPSNRCGEDWPSRPLERLRVTARLVRARLGLNSRPALGA